MSLWELKIRKTCTLKVVGKMTKKYVAHVNNKQAKNGLPVYGGQDMPLPD